MIRLNFLLNKKTISAEVPESWDEVKLKHIIRMEANWSGESKDMIGLLTAFTDRTYEEIEHSKENLFEPLFRVLSFVFQAPDWKKIKKPKEVTIGGKVITPPTNLNLEAFGQKVKALQLITNEKNQIYNIPGILAIYLQPAYDGLFSMDRVDDIEEKVLEMKAVEAMPFGLFFFKRLLKPKRIGRIGLRVSRRTLKRLTFIQQQVVRNSPNLTTC